MQHIIEVTSLELSSGFPCWFLFVCPLSNARNHALLFALYLRNGRADFYLYPGSEAPDGAQSAQARVLAWEQSSQLCAKRPRCRSSNSKSKSMIMLKIK